MVVLGFSTASYLICSSYLSWQQSPISTSSSTRPIKDLEFPTVTVCPPWGSNTALNYDLLKAENQSLTKKDREDLKEEIYQMFLRSPHENHVSFMHSLVNPNDVDLFYQGFHSVPKPYGPNGFEILARGMAGTIGTPGYEGSYDESFHKDSRLYI